MSTFRDAMAQRARRTLSYIEHQAELHRVWLEERDSAEREPCEYCRAEVGTSCTNPLTGEVIPAPAHWQRIRARARRVRGTSRSTPAAPSSTRSAGRSSAA